MEMLLWIADYLDAFNNYMEFFILLFGTVSILYLVLSYFLKAVQHILGPLGMPFGCRIRALFICRYDSVVKRAFLEFAILRSRGSLLDSGQWNVLLNEFRRFYKENAEDLCYSLDTCTSILGADFSNAVARYFKYFSKPANIKRYGIRTDAPISWLIRLSFEESFITPTFLLTGLLSRYEANWEVFIAKFISSTYAADSNTDPSTRILPHELYFTFAWLLWGPSYELKGQENWQKICQLSYGDESNSVPVFLKTDGANGEKLRTLWDMIGSKNDGRFGQLVQSICTLYDARSYMDYYQSSFNPANRYLRNHIKEGDISFALKLKDYRIFENYKSRRYYCTAYVWIMFEVVSELEHSFRPERSIAFFEHANLADSENYRFLINTLIEKCLLHFRRVFADSACDGRRYRLVTAMNSEIEERFLGRLQALSTVGDPVIAYVDPVKRYGEDEIFSAFDKFFESNDELRFREVELGDERLMVDLGEFYTNIYVRVFPDENERESFDNLLGTLALKKHGRLGVNNYHILLGYNRSDSVVGGVICDYFRESNSGVIEFIAVHPNSQSTGLGTQIYDAALACLTRNARAAGYKCLKYMFCEIDNPYIIDESNPKKYFYFWKKMNYSRINFNYLQPSLSAEKSAVENLWLIVSRISSDDATSAGIARDTILSLIHDYIKYSMRIEDPKATVEFQRMTHELNAGSEYVGLSALELDLMQSKQNTTRSIEA